jgi:glycosyltransferase involved in cell wall biosynthesis
MLTVVIPTYNRCETLKKALAGYLVQKALQEIAEIIVVDDGSTDSTAAIVAQASKESAAPIRYFRQENKGPAAARNVGIREARSKLILFTDDDIIPSFDLVAEHIEWHSKYPGEETAVLGYVSWAPEINPTPFMAWYGSDGALFSYGRFAGQIEIDYLFFYTCNLSLNKQFVQRNGLFDEDFKTAAYEDIELGYRLKKAGLRLLYNAKASACHLQRVSFDDACRRYRKGVAAAEVFKRKEAGQNHPSDKLSPLKQRLKRPLASALSPLRSLMDCRLSLPWSVYRTMFRICR